MRSVGTSIRALLWRRCEPPSGLDIQRAAASTISIAVRSTRPSPIVGNLLNMFSRLFDRKGKLLPPDKMPEDVLRAIDLLKIRESVKGGLWVRTSEMVEVADKTAALDALAKPLGCFPNEPMEHSPTPI